MNQHEDSLPTSIPKEFNDYRVESYIGHGSYGEVYRVFREGDVECALKILRPEALNDATALGRFENEIWALGQLDHDAIPKLLDQGIWEGRRYFVMSLARGSSLRALHKEQMETHGASAEMKVVTIIEAVLDALAYMNSMEIFHRDVKDDNILVTDSLDRVTLVDLGFCRGTGQPETGLTIWNAGAMHYSPPSKITNPSVAHPTHDVFAVGVVAYLLLTNQYPWDVSPLDPGKLAALMISTRPSPANEVNSLVDSRVATFIEKLLVIDDDDRPTAQEAKEELEKLRESLASAKGPMAPQGRMPPLSRVVRDPVHKDIRFTEYEWRIVNTPEFQRLRWMKQLAFSNIVYPGAEHSRMNHAFGTVYVVDKILRSIEEITGVKIDSEKRLLARCYALIHDVGHIAFGHTLEDELGFFTRHDENVKRFERLFSSETSEIGAVLKSTSFGRQALVQLNPEASDKRFTDIADLVEGSTGADVLDYVDRDCHFCGLEHRIDSALYRRFRFADPRGDGQHLVSRIYGNHGIRLDAMFGLESVLVERFALFLKVYTHPAKVVAGAMLGKALEEPWASGDRFFGEGEVEKMSDVELLMRLRESKRSLSSSLAKRLIDRKLYQTAFRSRALRGSGTDMASYAARQAIFKAQDLDKPIGKKQLEEILAKKAGLKAEDVVVYVSPKAPGLQKVTQHVEDPQGSQVLDDVIRYQNIVAKHLKLWSVYVFASDMIEPRRVDRLGKAAETHFSLNNEIKMDRRQGVLFDDELSI